MTNNNKCGGNHAKLTKKCDFDSQENMIFLRKWGIPLDWLKIQSQSEKMILLFPNPVLVPLSPKNSANIKIPLMTTVNIAGKTKKHTVFFRTHCSLSSGSRLVSTPGEKISISSSCLWRKIVVLIIDSTQCGQKLWGTKIKGKISGKMWFWRGKYMWIFKISERISVVTKNEDLLQKKVKMDFWWFCRNFSFWNKSQIDNIAEAGLFVCEIRQPLSQRVWERNTGQELRWKKCGKVGWSSTTGSSFKIKAKKTQQYVKKTHFF